MPVGKPCSGPSCSPLRAADSALIASFRACAKSVAAIALTVGLSASIRAIDASTSSTGETSLVPMRRRISTDDSDTNSSDSDMILALARLGSLSRYVQRHDIMPSEHRERHETSLSQ